MPSPLAWPRMYDDTAGLVSHELPSTEFANSQCPPRTAVLDSVHIVNSPAPTGYRDCSSAPAGAGAPPPPPPPPPPPAGGEGGGGDGGGGGGGEGGVAPGLLPGQNLPLHIRHVNNSFFFKNVDELGIPAVLLALLGVGVAIVRRLATLAATVPAAAAAAAAATTRGVGRTRCLWCLGRRCLTSCAGGGGVVVAASALRLLCEDLGTRDPSHVRMWVVGALEVFEAEAAALLQRRRQRRAAGLRGNAAIALPPDRVRLGPLWWAVLWSVWRHMCRHACRHAGRRVHRPYANCTLTVYAALFSQYLILFIIPY